MLFESFLASVGVDPVGALRAAWESRKDRPRLKQRLAELSQLSVDRLPVNQDVLNYALAAQKEGREVVLASGSDKHLVQALAERLGFPGQHLGSEPGLNLTGRNKASVLVERYGERGFDYVGNAEIDLDVWAHARTAIAVAPAKSVERKLSGREGPVREHTDAIRCVGFSHDGRRLLTADEVGTIRI